MEPVDLFIQNNCIQWMDEFLYMKRIQRFGYDSKWIASSGWMNLFRMDGIQCIVLFFSSFCFPRLTFPTLPPKRPFPQWAIVAAKRCTQRGFCALQQLVSAPLSPAPDRRCPLGIYSPLQNLLNSHCRRNQHFRFLLPCSLFSCNFCRLEVVCLHVHRVGQSVQLRTLPFPYLFSSSSSSSLLQFSTGLRFTCQCYWYSFHSKEFASVKELLYFQVCFCRSL